MRNGQFFQSSLFPKTVPAARSMIANERLCALEGVSAVLPWVRGRIVRISGWSRLLRLLLPRIVVLPGIGLLGQGNIVQ